MLDFGLTGKKAVVCASSKGLGLACADALAQTGVNLVMCARGADTLEAAAEELRGKTGVDIKTVACDITTEEGRAAVLEAAGHVDILVNNAGITRDNLFMRMKDEEWDDVLEVNLTSSMLLCRSAIRAMMKARWGRIISISSIVGVTGNPGQTNYAASKAGMIGFSKSLAAEVASRGITVNVVAPGFIETPMTDELTDEQKQKLLGNVPAGRLGSSQEVAAAVSFLASEEAAYMTGATLHVNGGMAML